MFNNVFIPYGGYYSSPFAKWQGSLQNFNSIELAAKTCKRWVDSRGFDMDPIEFLYLGYSIGQKSCFFGATWAAHMLGRQITGQTVQHACATSTTAVYNASLAVEHGGLGASICLMGDRCSNGPHTIWPNPLGPGAEVISENWNMDNMAADPATGFGMLQTAENVAAEGGFTREQADELTLRRFEQYAEALANDREFQKRYMFAIEQPLNRKTTITLEADEGVSTTSKEALAKLKTLMPDGIHTFGSQTHPADGNAAVIVTNKENADKYSKDTSVTVQVVSYGFGREKPAFMPAAPAIASKMALQRAGISASDLVTVKNHNPFIANDLDLAKKLGIDPFDMNNYGSSMIFGHPQGPTLARLLIEGIEETVIKGGGYALITGCAAGDSAAALVLKIS